MREKGVLGGKQDTNVAGPDSRTLPRSCPKICLHQRSVGFLQTDNISLEGAKVVVRLLAALRIRKAANVKSHNL
jgi:hypothetical protein